MEGKSFATPGRSIASHPPGRQPATRPSSWPKRARDWAPPPNLILLNSSSSTQSSAPHAPADCSSCVSSPRPRLAVAYAKSSDHHSTTRHGRHPATRRRPKLRPHGLDRSSSSSSRTTTPTGSSDIETVMDGGGGVAGGRGGVARRCDQGRAPMLPRASPPSTRRGGVCYKAASISATRAAGCATIGDGHCYKGRLQLLQAAAAGCATIGDGHCYKGRLQLLQAAAAATCYKRWTSATCYKRRTARWLLQTAAGVATNDGDLCYKPDAAVLQGGRRGRLRRWLLQMATAVATHRPPPCCKEDEAGGGGGCCKQRWPLVQTAAAIATNRPPSCCPLARSSAGLPRADGEAGPHARVCGAAGVGIASADAGRGYCNVCVRG
jgi:hypothetical protein